MSLDPSDMDYFLPEQPIKRRRLTPPLYQDVPRMSSNLVQAAPPSTISGMQYHNAAMSTISPYCGLFVSGQQVQAAPPMPIRQPQSVGLPYDQLFSTSMPRQQPTSSAATHGWPALAEPPRRSPTQYFLTPDQQSYSVAHPRAPSLQYRSFAARPGSSRLSPFAASASAAPSPHTDLRDSQTVDFSNGFSIADFQHPDEARLQPSYATSARLPQSPIAFPGTSTSQPSLTIEALERHMEMRNNNHDCNLANLTVPGPNSMSGRRRSKGPYICVECGMELKTFKEHERHNCTRFPCPFCSNTMSRKEYVVRHIKMRSCKHMTEEQRTGWLAARERRSTSERSSSGRQVTAQVMPPTVNSFAQVRQASGAQQIWDTADLDFNMQPELGLRLQEDEAANIGSNDWLNLRVAYDE